MHWKTWFSYRAKAFQVGVHHIVEEILWYPSRQIKHKFVQDENIRMDINAQRIQRKLQQEGCIRRQRSHAVNPLGVHSSVTEHQISLGIFLLFICTGYFGCPELRQQSVVNSKREIDLLYCSSQLLWTLNVGLICPNMCAYTEFIVCATIFNLTSNTRPMEDHFLFPQPCVLLASGGTL